MSVDLVRWTDPFALLIPISQAAEDSLRLRNNRFQIDSAAKYHIAPSPGSRRRKHVVGRLNFRLLIGRDCLTIGKARSNAIQLADHASASAHHLHISLDIHTCGLLITDTSPDGTRILSSRAAGYRTLRRAAAWITGDTHIRFGADMRYHFVIRPTRLMTDAKALQTLIAEYARSVQVEPPLEKGAVAAVIQKQAAALENVRSSSLARRVSKTCAQDLVIERNASNTRDLQARA